MCLGYMGKLIYPFIQQRQLLNDGTLRVMKEYSCRPLSRRTWSTPSASMRAERGAWHGRTTLTTRPRPSAQRPRGSYPSKSSKHWKSLDTSWKMTPPVRPGSGQHVLSRITDHPPKSSAAQRPTRPSQWWPISLRQKDLPPDLAWAWALRKSRGHGCWS